CPRIGAARADALFASALQRSEQPSARQVRQAIGAALRRFGDRGRAGQVAQEFGAHPELAVARMRWARRALAAPHRPPPPGPARPAACIPRGLPHTARGQCCQPGPNPPPGPGPPRRIPETTTRPYLRRPGCTISYLLAPARIADLHRRAQHGRPTGPARPATRGDLDDRQPTLPCQFTWWPSAGAVARCGRRSSGAAARPPRADVDVGLLVAVRPSAGA